MARITGRWSFMPFGHVHHVALTVSDQARSHEWYTRVLGWQHVWSGDPGPTEVSVGALPDGTLLCFWTHPGGGDPFDFTKTGLDHVSFTVDSLEELSAWEKKLDDLGIPYSPPADAAGFGLALNFKDPDGIALELFVPTQAVPPSEDV
jgi:glyoxylase I family protein